MTDDPRPEEPASTATETPPPEGVEAGADGEKKPEKLTQTVEMKDIGPCKKHVKVIVDRGAIDNRLKEKFSELVKNSDVPGFRPGKAPSRLVERRYKEQVGDQVKIEVLYASLEQLADETDLAPLTQPQIDPERIEMPKEGPFVYEFEVEVRPEFDLPDYKGLKLKKPVHAFTDEDVDREQRRILQSYGQVVPKPDGNTQIGDVLIADAIFKYEGNILSEAKEAQFRVEKQLALKDAMAEKFGEQVVGANAGDTKVVDMQLSSQSANPALRGQMVKMELAVKEVKTIRLPELTEEFLKEHFDLSRPEQLTELIRASLDRRLEYQQRQSARQQVAAHIATTANWQLPQDLLVRQARRALGRRIMEMRSDGMAEEEIEGRVRVMQQNILHSTELSLKEHFVLQKIAEVEKIEVNDDDIEAEIDRMAEQYGESPRRVRARLEKEDMIESLAAEMIERKALDLILDSATYEETAVGEDLQSTVSTSEGQAVPGEMRDMDTEAAASEKAAEGEPAASEKSAEGEAAPPS